MNSYSDPFSHSHYDPRDRTEEFFEFVQFYVNSNNRYTDINQESTASEERLTLFEQKSRALTTDIYRAHLLLQDLSEFCENISLFDDKSDKIDPIISSLRKDVNALSENAKNLEIILQRESKNSNSQLKVHQHSIIALITTWVVKLSSQFRDVLRKRSNRMKKLNEKNNLYSSYPLLAEVHTSPIVHLPSDSYLEEEPDVSMRGNAQQLQMERLERVQRYEEIRSVESTVIELSSMMQQLAVYVKEQEEAVQRVETSIGVTNLNLEAANRELMKYLGTISRNRSMMFKMFAVLLIFVIVFIVIS